MSVVCDEDGAPVVDRNGQPRRLLAIWPAGQARLIDTWESFVDYVESAYTAIGSYFLTRDRAGGPQVAGRPFL